MADAEMKTCVKCHKELAITKFKTNGPKPDGTRSRMATCVFCTADAKRLRDGLKAGVVGPDDSVSNVGSGVSRASGASGLSDDAIKQINDSFQKMMETISGRR